MHNITKSEMLDRVSMSTTYFKGNDYYKQGNVKNVRTNPKHDYFVGNIYGSEVYDAEIRLNADGYIQSTKCNCKAYKEYSGDCKHIVALLFFINNLQNERKRQKEV